VPVPREKRRFLGLSVRFATILSVRGCYGGPTRQIQGFAPTEVDEMMQSSLATLQRVQAARTVAIPELATEPAPLAAQLEAFRKRNAALDGLFYDISVVTPGEAHAISPWLAWEGSILHVPPTGQGALTVCRTIDDLNALEAAPSLTIAGVGSSALGSAAFARNVADATGMPAVAVVSGYGLSDFALEAAGGWFLFGGANRTRGLIRSLSQKFESDVWEPKHTSRSLDLARFSRDTATVIALLKDPRFDFTLLTGHSKGNLVLSEALYALTEDEAPLPIPSDTRIVTVSAAIFMPSPFTDIVDVMGAWDWFGDLNSSPRISIDISVPRAWHHTNREIPYHLPVTEALRAILGA
jgi:hypothetical protein